MAARDTVQAYFDQLNQKSGWEAFLADDMVFNSFVNPVKHVVGRDAYLESTRRFFAMITTVEIKDLIVEGDKACASTRYELQPPAGLAFESHVAEVITVRDGKITALDIYFDSAPFPRPTTKS